MSETGTDVSVTREQSISPHPPLGAPGWTPRTTSVSFFLPTQFTAVSFSKHALTLKGSFSCDSCNELQQVQECL